jgi:hypothetical protein
MITESANAHKIYQNGHNTHKNLTLQGLQKISIFGKKKYHLATLV